MYNDKATGRPKGEATVTYDDANAAKSAISWFDGNYFSQSSLFFKLSTYINNNIKQHFSLNDFPKQFLANNPFAKVMD